MRVGCRRGMLLDEDEDTGEWIWLRKFARCPAPTIPYNNEDADWVELEAQEVQDLIACVHRPRGLLKFIVLHRCWWFSCLDELARLGGWYGKCECHLPGVGPQDLMA